MFKNIKNILNPNKTKWYRKDEWYRQKANQNVYEVVDVHDCKSWDLRFWFFDKYKHKDTCEERWRRRRRVTYFDTTIFETPEKWISKVGKNEDHYKLLKDIEVYDGPTWVEK